MSVVSSPWLLSRRQPVSPFFPGAWPNHSHEARDHDASTASYPETSDITNNDKPLAETEQRGWTYTAAGSSAPSTAPCPETPTSPDFVPFTATSCRGVGIRLAQDSSSPLQDRFPTAYLDPPLLKILPGLPPLKLPQEVPSEYELHDSPPTSPSPLSDSGSPPPSLSMPPLRREYHAPSRRSSTVLSPSGLGNDYFLAKNASPEPSPQLTIASLPTSLYVSDADSLIIPPTGYEDLTSPGFHHSTFVQTSPSAPDMDAFALAAAVASAASRSSLSIPPSMQSASASLLTGSVPVLHKPPWDITVGRPLAPAIDAQMRRGTSWSIPGIAHGSRVDVGEHSFSERSNSVKRPVFGKMRRFGERIRGLFKTKAGSPAKQKTDIEHPALQYGFMTTTTAVTNVEYQSEHPIPLPIPRAKIMRNHRRSLPLPSALLPSSAENLASLILKRPAAPRSNTSYLPDSTVLQSRDTPYPESSGQSSHATTDCTTSPHTPKPQRQRTQTAPQARDLEYTEDETKARRFSLSSALSRSRLEAIRSTVMPRPPLPSTHSRSIHDHASSNGLSRTGTRHSSLATRTSVECRSRGDTVTTITQGVPFDIVKPRQGLDLEARPLLPPLAYSNRTSLAPSVASSLPASAYFDAREQLSEDNHRNSQEADRSCSPTPESDLDSMSFARTADYSSGSFSYGSASGRDREDEDDHLSIPGSYRFRGNSAGRCASTSALSRLVSETTSAPVAKTLRFSPSLSLSFERSWCDGEEDEFGVIEQEEDRGFMQALGFEFDEIARRARDEI
ncbi:hypothetical protein BN946_scf184967.g14 [Trametes cinnabarina]|uniref:Uncharacterized protein n=1 Tax=Pycnoporus cinnabarinus TaxID=5643 RepID=A0A060SM46_PYCCI|nr:hypothetical protein BN946_scf184967.g14 [Trametes cinnabarina]